MIQRLLALNDMVIMNRIWNEVIIRKTKKTSIIIGTKNFQFYKNLWVYQQCSERAECPKKPINSLNVHNSHINEV
jgi:hypothetical protein